jgi:ATP-dependent Clp protease ATP-binding subunit ClpA
VVIILTTNAGAREMTSTSLGFGPQKSTDEHGKSAIERTFSPEFRNRLDAWISFNQLTPEVILKVVDKLVAELEGQLEAKGVTLELAPEAREWLALKGFDKHYGARPMARLIQEQIKRPLADAILFGSLEDGGVARVIVAGEKLVVEPRGS